MHSKQAMSHENTSSRNTMTIYCNQNARCMPTTREAPHLLDLERLLRLRVVHVSHHMNGKIPSPLREKNFYVGHGTNSTGAESNHSLGLRAAGCPSIALPPPAARSALRGIVHGRTELPKALELPPTGKVARNNAADHSITITSMHPGATTHIKEPASCNSLINRQ